jgi:hypothetical protein
MSRNFNAEPAILNMNLFSKLKHVQLKIARQDPEAFIKIMFMQH